MLGRNEKNRYLRQIILPKFGEEAQIKLKNSAVMIAGAGGLGGPVSIYLAAAGVGHIILCDNDDVDLSNLNRQILHGTVNISESKASSAQKRLNDLNPTIRIETHKIKLDEHSITKFAQNTDIILDCLDNVKTRLLLNTFSLQSNTAIMHAGIDNWSGQITLLHPPETPCMNCLFSEYAETSQAKPVLGAVAGIIGATQALETIKFLTGIGNNLENTLLYLDALSMEWSKVPLQKNPACRICS